MSGLCFVLPDSCCLISMVKAEMFGVGGSFTKLSRKSCVWAIHSRRAMFRAGGQGTRAGNLEEDGRMN